MALAERTAGGAAQAAIGGTGVIVALGREARALRRGGLGSKGNARLICAGQGRRAAEARAGRRAADGATALVSIGFSAGLRPGLAAGSVVVAASVLGPAGEWVACDATWASDALAQLAPEAATGGRAVEVASIVATPLEKAELARRSGADVADMESHAVASVARAFGLPCLVIRVVLDGVDQSAPSWLEGTIRPDGRVSKAALMRGLMTHPDDVLSLVRLGRAAKTAEARLSRVAAILAGGVAFR